jgi:hypothetical protein
MGGVKRGGYIFVTWKGDHGPWHVHVFRDGRLILKFNLEAMVPMYGEVSRRILKTIKALMKEGLL